MSLLCVGVISPTNAPVHVQVFAGPGGEAASEDADLGGDLNAFLHVLHCSLDVVEERLRTTTIKTAAGGNAGGAVAGAGKGPKDPFLGMVFPTEDYRVYAYVTNTRARLLLLYDDTREPVEGSVREAFRRLNAAYVDAMSNPFAARGGRIDSPRFAAAVRGLAAAS